MEKLNLEIISMDWTSKKSSNWKVVANGKLVQKLDFNGSRITQKKVLEMVLRRKKELFGDNINLFFKFKKVL